MEAFWLEVDEGIFWIFLWLLLVQRNGSLLLYEAFLVGLWNPHPPKFLLNLWWIYIYFIALLCWNLMYTLFHWKLFYYYGLTMGVVLACGLWSWNETSWYFIKVLIVNFFRFRGFVHNRQNVCFILSCPLTIGCRS